MDSHVSPDSPRLYFGEKSYTEVCKIESSCDVKAVVEYLERKLSDREITWFKEHPQFCHIFHMHKDSFRKQMGLWLLVVRTATTLMTDECWFVVNGVPIRYSVREHALITGLFCNPLQKGYQVSSGSSGFSQRCFPDLDTVNISDVHTCLDSMEEVDEDDDCLKMAVLYFLGVIFKGKKNKKTAIDKFLVNVVDDLPLCQTFPWGTYTFLDCVKSIHNIVEKSEGIMKTAYAFPGFILGLERLAFESILNLKKAFLEDVVGADGACPRMCKTSFVKNSLKGYSLESIYKELGDTKEIQSILECKPVEEPLLANIVEEHTNVVDLQITSWKESLREKKFIWWEDLYNRDLSNRKTVREAQAEEGAQVQGAARVQGAEHGSEFEREVRKNLQKEVRKEVRKKTKHLHQNVISLQNKCTTIEKEI